MRSTPTTRRSRTCRVESALPLRGHADPTPHRHRPYAPRDRARADGGGGLFEIFDPSALAKIAAVEELPDSDEQDATGEQKKTKEEPKESAESKKRSYTAINASGIRDFLQKPEWLRTIVNCGFEHLSEVQHECISQVILGTDVLCQAKSGMGNTAVFVLACLQQIDASERL